MPVINKYRAKINWNTPPEGFTVKARKEKKRVRQLYGRQERKTGHLARGYEFVFSDDIRRWMSTATKKYKPLF